MAQWLVTDTEVAQQVTEKPATTPTSNRGGSRAASVRQKPATALLVPSPAAPASPPLSQTEAKILKMRPDFSGYIGLLTLNVRDKGATLFMHELSERLFFSADCLAFSYVTTVRKLVPMGHKVQGQETTRYFEAQEPAIHYLMGKVYGADHSHTNNAWQFELKNPDGHSKCSTYGQSNCPTPTTVN